MDKKKIKPTISKTPQELAEVLGLSELYPMEWAVRHEVTLEIIRVFNKTDITITQFAIKAETSRSRITRILKGDTVDISLDVLFRVLGALGRQVRLKFSKVG